MPVSCTSKRTRISSATFHDSPRTQADRAAVGELDGVAGVVEQGLAQARRVAVQPGQIVVAVDLDGQPLPSGLIGDQRTDVVEHRRQREVGGFQFDAAGFDLRQVEDVVDDGQQVLRGGIDLVETVGLFAGRIIAPQQVGQAE